MATPPTNEQHTYLKGLVQNALARYMEETSREQQREAKRSTNAISTITASGNRSSVPDPSPCHAISTKATPSGATASCTPPTRVSPCTTLPSQADKKDIPANVAPSPLTGWKGRVILIPDKMDYRYARSSLREGPHARDAALTPKPFPRGYPAVIRGDEPATDIEAEPLKKRHPCSHLWVRPMTGSESVRVTPPQRVSHTVLHHPGAWPAPLPPHPAYYSYYYHPRTHHQRPPSSVIIPPYTAATREDSNPSVHRPVFTSLGKGPYSDIVRNDPKPRARRRPSASSVSSSSSSLSTTSSWDQGIPQPASKKSKAMCPSGRIIA